LHLLDKNKNRISDWRLKKGLSFFKKRFLQDWQNIPEETRKSWSVQLTLGWIICCTIMALLTIVLQNYENGGLLNFDRSLLNIILKHSFIPFDYAIWVETPGNAVYQLPVALIGVVFAVLYNKPLRAITILASFLLGSLIVLVGWLGWERMRPDYIYEGIASPNLHSFPSGHVILSIGVFGYLTYLWIRKSRSAVEKILGIILLMTIVFLIGLSRLVLGTHWPSDIFASIFIGTIWLFVMILISEKYKI